MQSYSSGSSRGIIRSLFDFSFTSLIANRVIKFLYGLLTILVTIGAIFIFVELARQGGGGTAVAIVVVPLYFFIYLVFWRIFMECLIVFFRMGDDIRAIREQGGRIGAPPVAPSNLPPPPRPGGTGFPSSSQFPPPPPPRSY